MQLTGAEQTSAIVRPPQANAFSSLGSEQFVKIIFAELANQDPLAPSDSKALLEQLSILRSIQADTDLSNRLSALVGQNELAAASGLIGRRVSGISQDLRRVEGQVASVSRTQSGAILMLKSGERVPMSSIDQVLGDVPASAGSAS
jgi:flagellar basal-body rod modification protein FlgD